MPKTVSVQLAQDWIDDKPVTGVHKLGEHVYVTCNPDSLHQGYRTHLWALKNRTVNAIVVPDRRTVTPPHAMSQLMDELDRSDQPRQELHKVNGEYEFVDVPCKIWKLAPVEVFLPEFQYCDLATLASHSLPVLERYAQHLIRRYRTSTSESKTKSIDRDWIRMICRMSNLGLNTGEERNNANQLLEQRRLVALAKNRLCQ